MTLRYCGAREIAKILGHGREKPYADGWVTCCPAHDDHMPSLRVTDGHTTVAFYCYALCDQKDILAELENRFEILPQRLKKNTVFRGNGKISSKETIPTPATTPVVDPWVWAQGALLTPPKANEIYCPTGYHETGRWAWKDAQGNVIMWNIRVDQNEFEGPKAKKQFVPMSVWRNGNRIQWINRNVPNPRPLYNLDQTDVAQPILHVEGEKTADAAKLLFGDDFWITTTGASSAASRADLSPMKNRPLFIATDMDGPGLANASALISNAPSSSITLLRIPTRFLKPEEAIGGDLANLTENGMTRSMIRGLIATHPEEWLVTIR